MVGEQHRYDSLLIFSKLLKIYRLIKAKILLTSSYSGWGTGTIARDASEIREAVSFFRNSLKRSKIVLMGHSTGCQDTMYYLTRQASQTSADSIDGAILQAPVSDREAMQLLFPSEFDGLLMTAKKMVDEGRGEELLGPRFSELFFGSPICASRWVSLADTKGGDDFFSSDLGEEFLKKETFGKVSVPLLILFSGSDEYVPDSLDKKKLVETWKNCCSNGMWSEIGGIVDGGTHNLGEGSSEMAAHNAVQRVAHFVDTIQ